MKLSHIRLVIGLMSLALIGIVALQVYQLQRAMRVSRLNFDVSVSDALSQVVDQLEGAELRTRLVRVSRELQVDVGQNPQLAAAAGDSLRVNLGADQPPIWPNPQRVRIRDSLSIVTEQETYIPLDSQMWLEGGVSYSFSSEGDSGRNQDLQLAFSGSPRALEIVNRTFGELKSGNVPIQDRVDSLQVDTLLRKALADQGILMDYHFLVRAPGTGGVIVQPASGRIEEVLRSPYQAQLFPYFSREQGRLHVNFPQAGLYAYRSVWVQGLLSLLFTTVILVTFWVTIRAILRQKKLSEMKTDFINNMTHELKTPIATISLATDALGNPKVQETPGMISRYAGIIKEENARMHRQVERVLQAARFDRREVELRFAEVDGHQLLREAAETFRLQVEQRAGLIDLDLQAADPLLMADAEHLRLVFHNLLDNANKYSPEAPRITIRTRGDHRGLEVEVQDHGQGISKADQADIFTRFYRVSTGNLHEVKGFGLGLSYVKEVVEAHGGEVTVQSVPGQGSTFRVFLPRQEASPPA
ncbi:MAG: sensor histidine kinase [Bacteroidetes bacterium]|nr:MAG: sensor histidine kinase [Bacteroidota bacterium]